jgi:predicted XRE-type DNA-binding protein
MRAASNSPKLTLNDALAIWRRRGRGECQHTIAATLGVNQGRVSEVLTGKRFPEAKELARKVD